MDTASFRELLEAGEISEALQLRLAAIEYEAQEYRQDVEAAKFSTAALTIIGAMLSVSPLVAVLAGCGVVAYGYTVYRDAQLTGRFCPLPLARRNAGELFASVSLMSAGHEVQEDPLMSVIGYIQPELAHEYELLMVAEAQLGTYLGKLPQEKRMLAYGHILRHTRIRRSFSLPPLQDVAAAITKLEQPAPSPAVSPAQSASPAPEVPQPETKSPAQTAQTTEPQTIDVESQRVRSDVLDNSDDSAYFGKPQEKPHNTAHQDTESVDTGSDDDELDDAFDDDDDLEDQGGEDSEDTQDDEAAQVELLSEATFRWEQLKDADQHPVLGLVGGQGAGKSSLVKYLVKHVIFEGIPELDAVALDMFGSEEEWGFAVVCEPADICDQMYDDIEEIKKRTKAYRQGVRKFTPLVRVFEESKDTIPEIKALGKAQARLLGSWQRKFGSATRKLKGRAIYVNTLFDAASLGMTAGERNAITIIFPGEKGIAAAMTDTHILKLGIASRSGLREQLQRSLKKLKRPALVYCNGKWYTAEVPELNEQGSLAQSVAVPTNNPSVSKSETKSLANYADKTASDFKVSDALGEPLKTIWVFCKEQNKWVTTREIYQKSFAVLKGKTVKDIRRYLGLLSDSGYGEIDEMDGDTPKSDSSVAFRSH